MQKTIIRKPISILLSLLLVLSVFGGMAFTASAVATGTFGDATWTLDDDGLLTVSGTGLFSPTGGNWFNTVSPQVKSVVIGDGISGIRKDAFENCSNLESVEIGNGITEIPPEEFMNASNLTSIKLGKNLRSIGSYNGFFTDLLTQTEADETGYTVSVEGFLKGTGYYAGQMFKAVVKKNGEVVPGPFLMKWSVGTSNSNASYYNLRASRPTPYYAKTNDPLYNYGPYGYADSRIHTMKCDVFRVTEDGKGIEKLCSGSKSGLINYKDNQSSWTNNELKNSTDFISTILFVGNTSDNLKTTIGKAGFAHVECSNVYITFTNNLSQAAQQVLRVENSNYGRFKAIAPGIADVTYTIYTSGCEAHQTQYTAASPRTAGVRYIVLNKPAVTPATRELTFNFPELPDLGDNELTITLNGETKTVTAANNTVKFTGLDPETNYPYTLLAGNVERGYAYAEDNAATLPGPETFTVNVKKLTGETYTPEVTGETTVAELKELLADPAEIPAAEQRIIFAGRELEDEKALSEYNIQSGSTLHLIGKAHTITWNNDDNTLIDTTNVAYGRVPTHDDPVKEADEYIYTFAGWSPEVTAVTGDAIYTATYTSEVNPAFVPPHTHDFTYAANEATLTATCQNADCDLPDSAVSFTINAPAKTRYNDGKSAAATLTGVDAFNEATGKTVSADDIKYYKGDQQLDAAPENAGTYQARITVEGATAVVEYTIAKMNPWYFVPGTRNATYGDTLADVSLPIVADGVWTWKDDLTTSVGNAGVKTFTAVYTPNDENFNTAEVAVTVNVAKANPNYEIPANLTATVGGTLADVTLPDGWAWQDSTEPVGAVGEKTFKATFTPDDIENYNIVENIDVPVNVGKALPAYDTPTGLTATYGDTLADVTLPDDANGVWSWKDDNTTSVGNAGENSFIAVFTPTDTDNYAVVEVPVTITVGKATPSFDVPTGLTATEGDTLANVALPAGWSWKDSGTSVGEAGEKTFKATFTPADTANYNVVENIDVTVTVSAKTPDTPDTPDTPANGDFRCGFCDEYERWKDIPVFGWFVSLVHIFVHMAAHIGHTT